MRTKPPREAVWLGGGGESAGGRPGIVVYEGNEDGRPERVVAEDVTGAPTEPHLDPSHQREALLSVEEAQAKRRRNGGPRK